MIASDGATPSQNANENATRLFLLPTEVFFYHLIFPTKSPITSSKISGRALAFLKASLKLSGPLSFKHPLSLRPTNLNRRSSRRGFTSAKRSLWWAYG